MKLYFIIFLHITGHFAFGQIQERTIYYDSLGLTSDSSLATQSRTLTKVLRNTYILQSQFRSDSGKWYYQRSYEEIRTPYKGSEFYRRIITEACCGAKNYHEGDEELVKYNKTGDKYRIRIYNGNNMIIKEGMSQFPLPFVWEDSVKIYYPTGKLKILKTYSKGVVLSRSYYFKSGKLIEDVHISADIDPVTYKDGDDLLMATYKVITDESRYPPKAKANLIMGTVYVSFVVTEEGEIECVHTIGGHPLLSEHAENQVNNLPRLIPARKDGKNVNLLYTIPFKSYID